MIEHLTDPSDSLDRQNEKLRKIAEALMRRVEESTNASGAAYAQFQRAAVLEQEVRARTDDLERALELLNDSNARLAQANKETEAARADLANAIETVQEGFALFNRDEELVLCNSRFGMHMPDIQEQLNPGLRFADYVELVSQSGFLSLPETMTPEDWAKSRLDRHADDHVVFNVRLSGNRWTQVSEHRTPDGGTVILQTDVTDIMRIERQERDRILDDKARLIRATLEHIDQGVCIFDNKHRMIGWNTRASELLAIPITQFQMGTRFETLSNRLGDNISFQKGITEADLLDWVSRPTYRRPLQFQMHRGRSKILSVFAQEMPDRGFVISFTDVTAERRSAQALYEAKELLEQRVASRTMELADALNEAERANASKSRFVAAASHDLLQPLSAAKLYVASLGSGLDTDTARTVAAKAESALNSVEHILEALLDISKLDSGRAKAHLSTVSVGELFLQMEDAFKPVAQAKGLSLRFVDTKARVTSDASYLRRILQNLLSNAIRYTETGKVLVGVRHRKNAIALEVWDTGIGIASDQRDIVFQEFQRLHSDASAAEGMGLGLAIVERACGLLQHPIHLFSEVGKGTGFSVEIPLARAKPEVSLCSSVVQKPNSNVLGNTVALLIENDENLRGALTMTIESWGVEVLECESESEAIGLLREIGILPDFVVADYQLNNGKTGTDAMRALTDEFGHLPGCIISANRSQELVQQCKQAKLPLFYKPIDPQLLKSTLEASVARGI
ncbi:PAS-domain containing protein [Ruegeria sp. HKCCD6428]|uniref:hybrid sensor histidine kinase/response regulator n=1 Tax=Ruegeria sp. HKCCD6428 TaxID=2683002 RepID=UPI0014912E24|nr:PAS-domain containing protein [Ruegeria sp. HKCCD6428]NOC85523.1 response regulator [Ruegeria sp. HKCCD6428]